MRGTILERNGSLRIRVSLGKSPVTGKYESYYETFHGNMKEAQVRLTEILHDQDRGIFTRPTKQTLGQWLQEWIKDYCEPDLSERSVEAYRFAMDRYILPKIGTLPLKNLQPRHVQSIYNELIKKGHRRTAKYVHQTLHRALKIALKQGLVARNVCDLVEVPKLDNKEASFLNESEVLKFMESAKETRYYSMMYLDINTGLRRSELLALRWNDIDLSTGLLTVSRSLLQLNQGDNKGKYIFKQPKTKKSLRTIPLPSTATQVMMNEYVNQVIIKSRFNLEVKDDDLIFCRFPDASPLRPDTVSKAFLRIARQAGLSDAHLHSMRHAHASILLSQGVDLKVISERLGHAGIRITADIYTHPTAELQQKAASNFDGFLTKKEPVLLTG